MWEETRSFLDRYGIPYADALPALRGQLQAGAQPYPITWDAHLNAVGQDAVARLLLGAVPARPEEGKPSG